MQRISKNKDGITLIILVITIIVLLIILSVTINYGLTEIHDASNKKMEAELLIVQEAVMQRYALVKSKSQLGLAVPTTQELKNRLTAAGQSDKVSQITDSANISLELDIGRPNGFVGTRLADPETILGDDFDSVSLYEDTIQNKTTYEKCYYLLDESDLLELGVEKGDDSKISDDVTSKERNYVVNYFTGEIFDIANKKYYKTYTTDKDPIYTQPTIVTTNDGNHDFKD